MLSKRLPGAVAAALVVLGIGASAAGAQVPLEVSKPGNAGPGTLRNAINTANASAGVDVIEFNLPAVATVLTPLFDLPAITDPVVLDGFSQPGPASGQPVVTIDAINTTRALQLDTDGSVVQGLVVNESSGVALADGIQVNGDGNKIEASFVGTDSAGAQLGFQNLTTGVVITGDANVVGNSVIAESDGDGLVITGDENVVQGNRLGLPFGGGLGNSGDGLAITGDRNRVVGRNVISENNGDGASIAGNLNRVEDNYVGVDETGVAGPGNVDNGVVVTGNQNLLAGNVLANNDAGALIDGTSNTIIANAIGTDADMTAGGGNGNDNGVEIHGNSNRVGGAEDDERNVISDSAFAGVKIVTGANNRVEGNRIGTDGDGVAALPNDDGVLVNSSFNVIEDNLLSGNQDTGVRFDADGSGPPINNVVEGNVIGLDATGAAALPNRDGIVIEDAHRNAIVDNTIAGNADDGVRILPVDLNGADGNWLTGNTIGGDGLGNGQSGVEIDGGDDNEVGQPGAARNTIAHNGEDGVTVATGQDNSVANNSIHDNDDLGIDLAADGASVNDGLLDLDAGPNGLQNHPKITGRNLVFELSDDPIPVLIPRSLVNWTLRSAAATHYRLEFYVSDGCDGSGRGEALDLVATRDVLTDANGLAQSSLDIDPPAPGATVSATATVTDPNGVVLGASSELAPCG